MGGLPSDPSVVLEGGVKALLYASLVVATGASAARWLLLLRVTAEFGASCAANIDHSVARIALLGACVALAVSGLLLGLTPWLSSDSMAHDPGTT